MSDSVCKDLYSTQRTYHITIIIYLTPLNAGPEFRFGNFSLSQVFTLRKKLQCLQGYLPAVFELYRGLWGAHFFLFFITEGILCACDGLTKIHKSYGGWGGGCNLGVVQFYIYIYIYIYVGPYEIHFNFSQIPFYFFINNFFVSIFLDSVFMCF